MSADGPVVSRLGLRIAFSPECHQEVIRRGRSEPCDRMAVAMRLDFNDSTAGQPYPVCARHVSKLAGQMVALADVVETATA